MEESIPDPNGPTEITPATDASTLVSRATYQNFMVLVTLLSLSIATVYYLVPLPETVDQVLYVVDSIVALVLLYDFFAHLFYAHGRFPLPVYRGLAEPAGRPARCACPSAFCAFQAWC